MTSAAERLDVMFMEAPSFDIDPPCEHSGHGVKPWHHGAAWALIESSCTECERDSVQLYICRSGYDHAAGGRVRCWCGTSLPTVEAWRLIALVRP